MELPQGHRTVWLKYLMNTSEPAPSGCSIYAARMEADYVPADAAFQPVQATFNWSERQPDRSLVERSHTQSVAQLPCKYTIDVGGQDHPVMNWLRVNLAGAVPGAKDGYADGKDVGGKKFVGKWVTYGKNLAVGKPYTCSARSIGNWGAGDPDGKKLTDGVAGPTEAGGPSYRYGACWEPNTNPELTLDLGAPTRCASFGMNFHGYPWWDVMKGEVKDQVAVLTSIDGNAYTAQGLLDTGWRWQDVPYNFILRDDEALTGATFRLTPKRPVTARYVRFKIRNQRIFDCTELEVLDSIQFEPFDLRIALPDEAGPPADLAPPDDGGFICRSKPGGDGRALRRSRIPDRVASTGNAAVRQQSHREAIAEKAQYY